MLNTRDPCLPAKEVRGYYDRSLRKFTKEIAEIAGTIKDESSAKIEKAYDTKSVKLYERLNKLFNVQ